ncbi:uncharacterized protein LOC116620368 isoform X2 [Nematostella vectensis]|uniref:uncharacterized protein LOC116620368 isoform X2 n=1 Tax=Nematostella vectensis TaxID=45351 RepID=UPI0020776ED8|nr:uncharacterized protein LOC116620368 isoform X2 [Nematostella vectensis]
MGLWRVDLLKDTNGRHILLGAAADLNLRLRVWNTAFASSKDDKASADLAVQRIQNNSECVYFDFDPFWLNWLVKGTYTQICTKDFLGVTKHSLGVLRTQSQHLQGLQDWEIVKQLKFILHGQQEENTKFLGCILQLLSDQMWATARCLWLSACDRIGNSSKTTMSAANPPRESLSPVEAIPTSTSVCTLFMCEVGNLPQLVTDASEYAVTTTSDMINNAVLLFVPLELLEETTQLLKSAVSVSSVATGDILWQLVDYVTTWRLDVAEDLNNLQEIDYVAVNDEDFHFVVNMPNLKRPILFIGVR